MLILLAKTRSIYIKTLPHFENGREVLTRLYMRQRFNRTFL